MSNISYDAIFKAAAAEFLNSMKPLPPVQQNLFASCASASQLLEDIETLDVIGKGGRIGEQHASRIERLVKKIAPFFKVVEILVQYDPIHAATIWGGLRLIIQTASRFPTLFEKLTRSLDALASSFPFLGEVTAKFGASIPKPLQRLLHHVHCDLLIYLSSLMWAFNIKDARKTQLVSSIICKPLDRMFDETIARMEFYSKKLPEYLELLQFKEIPTEQDSSGNPSTTFLDHQRTKSVEATDATLKDLPSCLEKLSEQHIGEARENVVHRIHNWLAASSFATRYKEVKAQREIETAQWIFDQPEYKSWLSFTSKSRDSEGHDYVLSGPSTNANVLWISGGPGCGKSVLAAVVLEDLKESNSAPFICYFFSDFKQPLANDITTAYRAILSQILSQGSQQDALLDKFTFAMKFITDGQLLASQNEMAELLTLCCEAAGPMYLVLDGLDEYEGCEHLIEQLSELSKIPSMKIAFFSRPTLTNFQKHIQGLRHLAIGRMNFPDIHLYLTNKLSDMVEDSILPHDSHDQGVIANLTLRSGGIFLWAKMMVVYLRSPALTLSNRLDVIIKVGSLEALDEMFARIVELIIRSGKASQQLSRQIFTWLLYARRGLQVGEVEEAVTFDSKNSKIPNVNEFNNFNSLIAACGGFVELTSDGESQRDCSFHFVHASVREYFLEKAKPGHWPLARSEVDAHIAINITCLRYLIYSMPAQPLSGNIGTDVNEEHLNAAFPFGKYAALNWPYHLYISVLDIVARRNSPTSIATEVHLINGYNDLLSILVQFLSQPRVLMAWIETCYTYKSAPSTQELRNWSSKVLLLRDSVLQDCAAVPKAASETSEFAEYLEELEHNWSNSLLKTPACIWEEITAFSPSSILMQNSAIRFHPLRSGSTPAESEGGREINKISQTTSDGVFTAVLSIWTSCDFDNFEKLRISNASIGKLFQTLDYSTGWVAKYELYHIETHERATVVTLKLNPSEVWLQLSQTLKRTAFQFPLSINHDGSHFTVLRTLYMLRLTSQKRALECKSELLRLPMNEDNESYWTFPVEESGKLILNDYYRFQDHHWERVYLYWVYFDQRTRHICFVEQIRAAPTTFTLFEIPSHSATALTTHPIVIAQSRRWLRKFDSRYAEKEEKEFQLAFHPHLPIIAVSANDGLYMWKFDDQDRMLKIGKGFDGEIGKPSFSDCGQYCILFSERSSISPIVFSLFLEHLAEGVIKLIPAKKPDSSSVEVLNARSSYSAESKISAMPSQSSKSGGSLLKIFAEGLSQENVIRGDSLTTRPDGSRGIMQVKTTNNSVEVRQQWEIGLEQESAESLTLTLLPNWSGIESIQPTVILPTTEHEPVRIVLDKAAQTWNSMSGVDSEIKFPAVVERDRRSFRNHSKKPDAILADQQDDSDTRS